MSNNDLTIYSSVEMANNAKLGHEKTIICRFRNPAREIALNVNSNIWDGIANIPQPYKELLSGVIYSAAKSIVSRFYLNVYDNSKTTVSSIPSNLLSIDNILDEAQGNNSEWLTKDELTEAWKGSNTRNKIYNAQRYATDRAYQKAYTRFEEMILKLAGKTSSYKPEDLDVILAKLDDGDLQTTFGAFIVKRIEALKNKPQSAEID